MLWSATPHLPDPKTSSAQMCIMHKRCALPIAMSFAALHCRNAWLLQVLAPLLPHMLARLSSKWATMVSQPALGRPSEDGTATNDEVVEERLVRELTREHLQLLLNMADKHPQVPGQGTYLKSCLSVLSASAVYGRLLPGTFTLHCLAAFLYKLPS